MDDLTDWSELQRREGRAHAARPTTRLARYRAVGFVLARRTGRTGVGIGAISPPGGLPPAGQRYYLLRFADVYRLATRASLAAGRNIEAG